MSPTIGSSVENRICVFRRRLDVQISDVYPIKIHIWKWLRSDAKKIRSRVGFCLHMCNKFRSVSDVSEKSDFFCASVNAAIV